MNQIKELCELIRDGNVREWEYQDILEEIEKMGDKDEDKKVLKIGHLVWELRGATKKFGDAYILVKDIHYNLVTGTKDEKKTLVNKIKEDINEYCSEVICKEEVKEFGDAVFENAFYVMGTTAFEKFHSSLAKKEEIDVYIKELCEKHPEYIKDDLLDINKSIKELNDMEKMFNNTLEEYKRFKKEMNEIKEQAFEKVKTNGDIN